MFFKRFFTKGFTRDKKQDREASLVQEVIGGISDEIARRDLVETLEFRLQGAVHAARMMAASDYMRMSDFSALERAKALRILAQHPEWDLDDVLAALLEFYNARKAMISCDFAEIIKVRTLAALPSVLRHATSYDLDVLAENDWFFAPEYEPVEVRFKGRIDFEQFEEVLNERLKELYSDVSIKLIPINEPSDDSD
ncbi:MAG: hypothetical protein KDD66_11095 [Bdellovibrionales bacterium]|nr:hypothetical protein [Bdellovibrionales bacterium]